MAKKAKLMIVVWKWLNENVNEEQRIAGGNGNVDVLRLKNQSDDCLLRYDPQKNIEDSLVILSDKIQEFKETHYIQLFLHRSHGYSREKHQAIFDQALRPDGKICGQCYFFGNASDHLYIQVPQSRFGLLGVDGNLGGDFGDELIEVFELDSSGQPLLKPAHFYNIWDYYYFNFRRKTFELMECLMRYYWPLTASHTITNSQHEIPSSLFQKFESYTDLIEGVPDEQGFNFLLRSGYTQDQIAMNYNPEAFQMLVALKSQFHQLREKSFVITHTDLLPLRNAFINLLNALPEKTYA